MKYDLIESHKKVRKDIPPEVQPRDKTQRKKLENVPEIPTRNHQQRSNLKGEELQRPNLPDLVRCSKAYRSSRN
jgi:hypothetical protein